VTFLAYSKKYPYWSSSQKLSALNTIPSETLSVRFKVYKAPSSIFRLSTNESLTQQNVPSREYYRADAPALLEVIWDFTSSTIFLIISAFSLAGILPGTTTRNL